MFDVNSLSSELKTEAASFGLKGEEFNKFCIAINRIPSREEIAVAGALWSEHCSYKSSRVHLKRFHTHENWVWQGPGENAGVVGITEDYGIAFKMESHNHPSYIEPYQGAATGVGGILRDVFCMGARPIANINCLRYGEGEWNAHLLRHTVRGIADYGNAVGVPTITGDTSFHYSYSKNILINAFTAGLIHKNGIYRGVLTDSVKSAQQIQTKPAIVLNQELTSALNAVLFPEEQNVLIYFGSATGRDGVHGATMSSSEFATEGAALKPTVQVGDPFAEKVLLEATLALIKSGLTLGLQDMGAAGLTSSSVEMAGRSGCGVAINLSLVPQRAANMQAFEILLSESQERMLAACKPKDVPAVLTLLRAFDIPCAIIGRVNDTGAFHCVFDNRIVTDIPVDTLIEDTPRYEWPLQSREEYLNNHKTIQNKSHCEENTSLKNLSQSKLSINLALHRPDAHAAILKNDSMRTWLKIHSNIAVELLSHVNFASRKPLFDHYCSTVQGQTVAGCGALQQASAGVVRLPREAQSSKFGKLGIAIAAGCEERWVELDPLLGSILSALKIARKIVAVGGVPLAMTDCLNYGSPSQAPVMRQFSDTVDGLNKVAKELQIPVVSGNVSLNNQTEGSPIPPTPMLGMVGKVTDVSAVPLSAMTDSKWQNQSHLPLVQIKSKSGLSSYLISQVAWLLGAENCSPVPESDLTAEKKLWETISKVLNEFKSDLCVPVGHGGLFMTSVKLALESNATLNFSEEFLNLSVTDAFAEGHSGFLLSLKNKSEIEKLSALLKSENMEMSVLGTLEKEDTLNSKSANQIFPWTAAKKAYSKSFKDFFNESEK